MSHLVHGLVVLHDRQAEEQSQLPPPLWHSHVLVKALCAHPEAAVQLLAFSGRLSQQAAPFLSFVLLSDAGSGVHHPLQSTVCTQINHSPHLPLTINVLCAGQRIPFAMSMHAGMLAEGGVAQVGLLIAHLGCQPLCNPQQRSFVLRAAQDLAQIFDRPGRDPANCNKGGYHVLQLALQRGCSLSPLALMVGLPPAKCR